MKNILVFGSFNVDLVSRTPHMPLPGETVSGTGFSMGPGGKGFNQCIAAGKAGGNAIMAAKTGNDSFSDIAIKKLNEVNLTTDYLIKEETLPTGTAIIMVEETTSQNVIVVNAGANGSFNDKDFEYLTPAFENCDYLLTQLETNIDAMERAIKIAKEKGATVILNPAPVKEFSDEIYGMLDVITPNEIEASILTGIEIKSPEDALLASKVFFERGVKKVIITLGKMGVLAATPEEYKVFSNYDVKVVDTTGAGDAFNGGFVSALADGKEFFDAVFFGNIVSNLAVSKKGAADAMPSRKEIDEFIKNNV